ncbi:MAG TPA: 3-beta hydroxysteroid dehydrogenase [Elusimicrobia bacterium]|nr:MAG: 3-beta hydroxysteroid dehydrogenase [Elusimicrobia bacterium GWD2_63_28]HCC48800.1 3-beta hydroxysteroid dehydrogenase [Elusimicrobiota bacterium]
MKALVTGGGGFLGGAIIRLLLAKGASVRSFSRGSYPELERQGVECLRGSLADKEAAAAACRGCDIVFHAAAKVGMWGRYEDFYRANVEGTANLLAGAAAAGLNRFVFTGSPSVVFNGAEVEGWNESAPYPASFDSHYSATKALAEQLVLKANAPGFATVSLRPHLIWGPGQNHIVSTIAETGKAGTLRRIGRANKLIDSTYIDDAAAAHWCAAERLAPGAPCAGKVYFISQGDPRPNWDIINMILAASGSEPVTKTLSYPTAYAVALALEASWFLAGFTDVPPLNRFVLKQLTTAHWFDISAARRDLGYAPSVTIEQGMEKLKDWFRSGGK